jgi:hypothetical protein
MKKQNRSILNNKGQGLTEYLILMILVCVVSIAAAKSLGGTIKRKIQEARQHINSDVSISE